MKTFLLLVSFAAISATTAFAGDKPACEERNLSQEDLQQCLSSRRANKQINREIVATGNFASTAIVLNTLGNAKKQDAARQVRLMNYYGTVKNMEKSLANTENYSKAKATLRKGYLLKGLAAVSFGLGAYEGWKVYDGIANAPADVVDSHNFAAKNAPAGVTVSDSTETAAAADNVDAK